MIPLYGRDARPVPLAPERCPHRKWGYFNQADAERTLAWLRSKRRPEERCEQRAYRCEDCPSWHLTAEPEWPPKRSAHDERHPT